MFTYLKKQAGLKTWTFLFSGFEELEYLFYWLRYYTFVFFTFCVFFCFVQRTEQLEVRLSVHLVAVFTFVWLSLLCAHSTPFPLSPDLKRPSIFFFLKLLSVWHTGSLLCREQSSWSKIECSHCGCVHSECSHCVHVHIVVVTTSHCSCIHIEYLHCGHVHVKCSHCGCVHMALWLCSRQVFTVRPCPYQVSTPWLCAQYIAAVFTSSVHIVAVFTSGVHVVAEFTVVLLSHWHVNPPCPPT